MKKHKGICITCVIVYSLVLLLPVSKSYSQERLEIEGAAGIEFSRLEWSIAGNIDGTDLDIFSELKWTELKSTNYSLQTCFNTSKISYFLRSSFSSNIKGLIKDNDYAGDDRTDLKYSETFNGSGGRNFVGEVGVKFPLEINTIPYVLVETGMKYKEQRCLSIINSRKSKAITTVVGLASL